MTSPRQYAALRALAYGLSKVLDDLQDNVVAFRAMTDSKSFTTPWGDVTFRKAEPSVDLPMPALVAWARERMPHEVIEGKTRVVPEQTITTPAAVRDSLVKTLKGDGKKPGRFRIVAGEVIDSKTGEVVEWARVVQPTPEVVFSISQEAKEDAPLLVHSRLAQITSTVAPELEP